MAISEPQMNQMKEAPRKKNWGDRSQWRQKWRKGETVHLKGCHVVESQIQLLTEGFALQLLSVHLVWISSTHKQRKSNRRDNRVGKERKIRKWKNSFVSCFNKQIYNWPLNWKYTKLNLVTSLICWCGCSRVFFFFFLFEAGATSNSTWQFCWSQSSINYYCRFVTYMARRKADKTEDHCLKSYKIMVAIITIGQYSLYAE